MIELYHSGARVISSLMEGSRLGAQDAIWYLQPRLSERALDPSEREKLYLSYEKLLNPQKLKANLLLASLYLTAHELMRSSTVDHVRGLFYLGTEDTETGAYNREVLQLYPRDRYHATCLWVQNNGGLTAADVLEIQSLRDKRNQVAHELPKLISDVNVSLDLSWLHRIGAIVAKFDRWWIRTFEIDVPDTVPDEEIHSGNMILIDFMLRTVDGRDDELEEIFQSWLKALKERESPTTG